MEEEQKKFLNASKMAGEYIEEIGHSDLACLTKEEWYELLHVIVKAYHETT